MINILPVLYVIAAVIVLVRTVCMASKTSAKTWQGHPVRFAGIAAANSLLASGALGLALGWHMGAPMLICGVVIKLLIERRRTDA